MAGRNRPRHGGPAPIDLTTWLGDDPHLALVNADMSAWLAAHPCDCEDLCRCDEQDPQRK
jgi:hypothetical protein